MNAAQIAARLNAIDPAINQAAEDFRLATGAPLMPLADAARQLELANNGYTFAHFMNPEFIRKAEQLVARGKMFKGTVSGTGPHSGVIYMTPRAYEIMAK